MYPSERTDALFSLWNDKSYNYQQVQSISQFTEDLQKQYLLPLYNYLIAQVKESEIFSSLGFNL